jgi:hypothetical protein
VFISGGMLVWGRGVGAPTSVDQLREMSLFHDFKLKRRKVDSRCSTEGQFKKFVNFFLFLTATNLFFNLNVVD